jgi:hypothetical protein
MRRFKGNEIKRKKIEGRRRKLRTKKRLLFKIELDTKLVID